MKHGELPAYREVEVAAGLDGMRLDRFLQLRFADRSRSFFARAIRDGLVRDARDRTLDCAYRVRDGELLRVAVPGIAPTTAAPPFPPILYEDARVVAVDKPAGLPAHPGGTRWVWALVSLAKERYRPERVDLVHRLDRDTSGVLLMTRDLEANRALKAAIVEDDSHKEYVALVKGVVPWDEAVLDGPIGPANGPMRIEMAVRADGLSARTDVTVLERGPHLTRVRCVLHSGRTHQIRVHLAHAGFPVLGDRLYGLPNAVAISILDHGLTPEALEVTGAPRHALHAHRVIVPHPEDGRRLEIVAPVPEDIESWWASQSAAGPKADG